MKKILITCTALLCSFCFIAQTNLSLEEAIQKAIENNYSILIQQKQVEIAENSNTWGETTLMPRLDLNGSYSTNVTDNSNNPTAFIQDRLTSSGINYGATLNWTLFDGFGMFAQKNQLDLLQSQTEGQFAVVLENTIQAVVLAYYEAQLQNENLKVIEELIDLSNDRLEYFKTKKELGAATTFEVLQFETALVADSTNYLNQDLAHGNAIRNLNLIMNESVDAEWILTTAMNMPSAIADFNTIEQQTLSNNQNIKNQFVQNLILKENTELTKSALYPVVAFGAGLTQAENNFAVADLSGAGETLSYFANFSLNFNLFNGGKTRRAIQNSKIQEEVGLLSLDQLKQSTSNELHQTYSLYEAQKKIYLMSEKSMNAAKLSLEIGEDRFKTGSITSFNYRDLQLTYLQAQTSRYQALYNLLATSTSLTRLSGGFVNQGQP